MRPIAFHSNNYINIYNFLIFHSISIRFVEDCMYGFMRACILNSHAFNVAVPFNIVRKNGFSLRYAYFFDVLIAFIYPIASSVISEIYDSSFSFFFKICDLRKNIFFQLLKSNIPLP